MHCRGTRHLAALGLAVLLATACRGHDPYSDVSTLADDGACEQAGTAAASTGAPRGVALTSVATPGGGNLRLISAGGVVLGLPACTAADGAACAAPGGPDLTSVTRAVRHVASCYEARGDAASLVKAFAQLKQIVESPLYLGSSDAEQERIDAQLDRVEARLGRLDPDYQRDLNAESHTLDQARSRARNGG